MNPQPFLLLDQQQPLVGVPLDLPALLLGLFIRPVAGHEERAQIDLVPGVDKLLLADALAVDRAQVDRAAAAESFILEYGEKKMTKLIMMTVMMTAHSQV